MTQTCTEVTRTVEIPGTGGVGAVPDTSWDSSARSVERAPIGGRWAYRFDPVLGSVFVTGLFDETADEPRPSNYFVSVRFEVNRFFIQAFGSVYGPYNYTSGRISIESFPTGYRVYVDSEEVWRL